MAKPIDRNTLEFSPEKLFILAIVKITDVGPLEPGRVIELNEQTMHYFDPDLQLGLVRITVAPLPGNNWSPGPVVCCEPLCNGVSG